MTPLATPASASAPSLTATPYAGLTPSVVLDALAAVALNGDGRLLQLNSFENRVFQVMLEDGSAVVTKFYRPGRWTDEQILQEHGFTLEAAEHGVPVVAPLGLQHTGANCLLGVQCANGRHSAQRAQSDSEADTDTDGSDLTDKRGPPGKLATLASVVLDEQMWRFAVWPRKAGRTPELEDDAVLLRLGRSIAMLHRVGERCRFDSRESREPLADGRAALQAIASSGQLPHDQEHAWRRASAAALDAIEALSSSQSPQTLRLHGDCHPGNLLWRDEQPNMVDFDDCAQGPAVQDLWMLLSGEPQAARQQLNALLAGYIEVRPFDVRELALIPALRLARLLRHNAWVAQRWADPAFPAAYPHFGSSSYWAQQALQLQEMAADSLGGAKPFN